jgi:hypothetical protein
MTFGALANQHIAHFGALADALRAHNLGTVERALWASAVGHSSRAGRPRGADPRWEVRGLREDMDVDMAVACGRCGCADSSPTPLRSPAEEVGALRDGVTEDVTVADSRRPHWQPLTSPSPWSSFS